jgi:hypothetical protein
VTVQLLIFLLCFVKPIGEEGLERQKVLGSADIVWHWEDEFSVAERKKMKDWLIPVAQATQKTLGEYPFDMHFHLHRRDGAQEPVPWANTWRYPYQSVHFHVDTRYSLEEFMKDWTAPHEMSHLALHYLGESKAWFAEGFASFMQAQVMRTLGVYDDSDVRKKYREKVDKAIPFMDSSEDPADLFRSLRKQHRYPAFYWGGATYFMQIHEKLKQGGRGGLPELVTQYVECCRAQSRSLDHVINSWDRILGNEGCAELLEEYRRKPAREVVTRKCAETY